MPDQWQFVSIPLADFVSPTESVIGGIAFQDDDQADAAFYLDAIALVDLGRTNAPPVADPNGPYGIDEGDDLRLDGTASFDPDSSDGDRITIYAWDLGGDGQFDAWGPSPTVPWDDLPQPPHSYTPITVGLQVTDSYGGAATASTDLIIGTLPFLHQQHLNLAPRDLWYAFRTAHQGFLTAEAAYQDGSVTVEPYDADRRLLAQSSQRIDWAADDREIYYLRLAGTSHDAELRICNLVSHTGTAVTVYGTDGNDDFEYAPDGSHLVTIKDVSYHFPDTAVTSIDFLESPGYDTAVLTGSADAETLTMTPALATLARPGLVGTARQAEKVQAHGGGGADRATLHGTDAGDTYTGKPTFGRLVASAGAFQYVAQGFPEVSVNLGAGADLVRFYESDGNDAFTAGPDRATFRGPGFLHQVEGFHTVSAFAGQFPTSGDHDTAELADDPAETGYSVTFHTTAGTEAKLYDGDPFSDASQVAQRFLIRTSGFDAVTATTGLGDFALLYGTSGPDHYVGNPQQGVLTTPDGAVYTAVGFEQAHSVARSGRDSAELTGSPGADGLRVTRAYGRLAAAGWMHRVVRYEDVSVRAAEGNDVARLVDTAFNDLYHGMPGRQPEATYRAGRFQYRLDSFHLTRLDGLAADNSQDEAHLWPRDEDEVIERPGSWLMRGPKTGQDEYLTIIDKLFGQVMVHPPANDAGGRPNVASRLPRDEDLAILAAPWQGNRSPHAAGPLPTNNQAWRLPTQTGCTPEFARNAAIALMAGHASNHGGSYARNDLMKEQGPREKVRLGTEQF